MVVLCGSCYSTYVCLVTLECPWFGLLLLTSVPSPLPCTSGDPLSCFLRYPFLLALPRERDRVASRIGLSRTLLAAF